MGFLDRFRKEQNYTLQQAMDIIARRLAEEEVKHSERNKETAKVVSQKFNELKELVMVFSKARTLNNHKGAEQIKDRFCSVTLSQIAALSGDIDGVRNTLNNLGGLTHKQIMYIKAFFEQDFQPVLRKTKEIQIILENNRDETADYRKATRFYKKIIDLEEEKKRVHADRIVNQEKVENLKVKLGSVSSRTVGAVDESELGEARRRAASLRQEIDSFLSVQKLFKKYQHDHNIKDQLLDEYIKSPSSAILLDKNLRIIDLTKNAFSACKDTVPEKKVNTILEGSIYLRVVRDDLARALQAAELAEQKFREQKSSAESALSEKQLAISDLESQIKNCNKIIEDAHQKYEEYNSEISKARADLCMLASSLVGGVVS